MGNQICSVDVVGSFQLRANRLPRSNGCDDPWVDGVKAELSEKWGVRRKGPCCNA
jgi:hypothetical protein